MNKIRRNHTRTFYYFSTMAAEGGRVAAAEAIPREATHINVLARVIPECAFRGHPNIVEVICHESVEKIERGAFSGCRSLRRVIMPGVKIVECRAFDSCRALTNVECGKLEVIKESAFIGCLSLKSISLPSARSVELYAFGFCEALTDVKFGDKLERFGYHTFCSCTSLERITIPLKDGLFSDNNTFAGCDNFSHVDLVEGAELHETAAALQLKEWRNDMNQEIDSINQILPNARAGIYIDEDAHDYGEKAQAIRRRIGSVLRKINHYQAEHQRILDEEVEPTLQLALPHDIVMNNILPFLELPSHTFQVGDDEDNHGDSYSDGSSFEGEESEMEEDNSDDD